MPKMLEAGARAPGFELPDARGGMRSLSAILAEGPALLAFYKASCPVCQFTFPFLERIYAGGGKGAASIRIVGISQDKPAEALAFQEEYGITFPILIDDSTSHYAVSNAFGVHTVPSLFLVEPDGAISASCAGFSRQELEALGHRMGVAPFRPEERIPDYRPG
jgi:peroxiredoxin